ncbi:Cullin repeat-like-containing domain protein [Peziza echinospora]|nr:Cullin repeat-like-containing domain protein [Peziza echinospora]
MVVTNMDEEAAEVEVLQSKLAKTADLTTKIQLSLQKLAASATNVEEAVKPIYAKTQTLTILSANIDATITAIDKIKKPLDVITLEEPTIRAGPQKVGLTEYLASLKRTNDGLSNIKATNLRSQQTAVTQITALLKTGSLELENLFRQTLAEESNAVEPLHYITKELPFPTFSSKTLNILAVLNEFLTSTLASACGLQSNATAIYTDLRGTYLSSTLSSLSQASITTAQRRAATPYDKGSNGIVIYIKALEAIFEAEWENICQLFPTSSWTRIYADVIKPAMTQFAHTVNEINSHVRANIITDCFLAYDVLESVHPTMSRLVSKTGEKEGFLEALKPIKFTATASFQEIIEDVKKKGAAIQTLPPDNGVLDFTINVMSRIRRLTDYKLTVTSLLVALGDKNWNRPDSASLPSNSAPMLFDITADGNQLLSNYLTDVIDTLIGQLEAKARMQIKKNATIAVFMINNVAYIESIVRKSELWGVMNSSTGNNNGARKIEAQRKKYVEMYLEGWKECAAYLMDVTYIKAGSKMSLSTKDKEAVKEKFKNFNTSFDELVQRHKQYTFPEKDVRMMLAKEISFIGPLYGRFHDKYKDIMRDKYIKYDRQTLDSTLASL